MTAMKIDCCIMQSKLRGSGDIYLTAVQSTAFPLNSLNSLNSLLPALFRAPNFTAMPCKNKKLKSQPINRKDKK